MGLLAGRRALLGALCLSALPFKVAAAIPEAMSPAPSPLAGEAQAQAQAQPQAPTAHDTLALSDDILERLTIPVMINGKGPFPFIIDTGSDRTVISRELAATLELPPGPDVKLQNSGGVDQVPTVVISTLADGSRTTGRIEAPVLTAANIGGVGMLGIDSLRDQHIVMDFKARQMRSSNSGSESYDPYSIVVKGKSRFGQLVLVDAVIRGIPIFVILDSGSQNTVGNIALQRLLTRAERPEELHTAKVISVTGRETPAQFKSVTEMHIGGLTVRNMPLAFADLHTFHRFELVDQPAMLLGMDVLHLCEKVSVDFKRREATFTVN